MNQDKEKREKTKRDKVKEQPVTYEMYAEMPDDGNRYEIFEGKLEMMSPGPSPAHQAINRELGFLLMQSCRNEYEIFYAPIDIILSETTVVQPDILMVHHTRKQIITRRGIEGPPDLAVEILSPSSHKRDKLTKRDLYAKFGVSEYWIIDASNQTLEQYQLIEEGYYKLVDLYEGTDVVTSNRLRCVSFTVSEIFRSNIH